MLVLFETPAGFALFKLHDEGKLKKADTLQADFEDLSKAKKIVTLTEFSKFSDTTEALAATTALLEGKVGTSLKQFLSTSIIKKNVKDTLAVADSSLMASLREEFPGMSVANSPAIMELFRCIRYQQTDLLSEGLSKEAFDMMSRGLAHSLGRYKMKFSADKVDVMIVQAISLLDDLSKEINTYGMRAKEWYGWHFPELVNVVNDNILYSRVVLHMGSRKHIDSVDLTDVLESDMADKVKQAAALSMGTDIDDSDLSYIVELCKQVVEISEYKDELNLYVKNRMNAIAPNLTILVGELVGARLIAHAGSLINLAKHPSSTIQILGAEKALFRALKTKKPTPKYGLIYHAAVVNATQSKNKGKISRILANKAALSCRVDALGDAETRKIGIDNLKVIHSRMRLMDKNVSIPKVSTYVEEYIPAESRSTPKANADDMQIVPTQEEKVKKEKVKKEKKQKKRKRGDDNGEDKKSKKKRRTSK